MVTVRRDKAGWRIWRRNIGHIVIGVGCVLFGEHEIATVDDVQDVVWLIRRGFGSELC